MATFLRTFSPDGIRYLQTTDLPAGGRDVPVLLLRYPRSATDRAWEVRVVQAVFDAAGTTFVDDDHPEDGPFTLATFAVHLTADRRGRITGNGGDWS